MTRATEPTPSTEAGRALLDNIDPAFRPAIAPRILAIEVERLRGSLDDRLSEAEAIRAGVHEWFCGESKKHGPDGTKGRPYIGWPCERGAAVVARALAERLRSGS